MKHKSQSGSAHVIIIVILILVILGLLGFVFWQNFLQKKDAATNNSTATTSTKSTDSTPTPKSTATALPLAKYNVEVPYDSTTDTYTTADITTGTFAGGYMVYSKKVTDACGPNVNVGGIKQFNPNEQTPTPVNIVNFGNYKYALGVGGYGDCSSNPSGEAILESASSAFADAFKNLKATN